MAEKTSINLDELIESLSSGSTPEEELINKMAGVKSESEIKEESPEIEKKAEEKSTSDELDKLAAEADDQGRIIARAFMDELNKIAVGDTDKTENSAEEGDNPALQLSNKEIGLATASAADNLIQGLTASVKAGGPQGTIGAQGAVQDIIPGTAGDEVLITPTSGTATKAASDEVVSELYKRYIEGSE